MERLEAALSKAREMRRTALSAQPAPGRDGALGPEAEWRRLPEIALAPQAASRHRLAAAIGGRDAVPYDMLRSRAIRTMREKQWTRVAVTSPDAGCGKTTIAANLALALSRQKDLRVMLVDLDLRRPGINRVFGIASTRSVWEVLERKLPFEEVAVRLGENLVIAGNAAPGRHPAETLHSAQTRDVLDEIEQRWRPDVMIFDMSPMLATDDNVGFLGNVDCAILVAAAESTRLSGIDGCEKELAQLTNVLGVVLNKCRYLDGSESYAYEGPAGEA